ncbi:MAG TPA: FAD-binding oxidoreductase [Xanthobacteraceae bacterium]|jgi:gamma-glutamylputrescine oxidase|nr:FAD-binding oxidoreductase [Xanthobacteraceae bacterium]
MEGADQSEFGRTWYSRVTTLPPARASLGFEIDVDVCIIGGGLAGLTVAREIVRRGWSAAVLEAKRIAWNASGRNSGLVMPGYPANIEKVVERIGLPATRALWALSEAGVRYVRDTIAEIGMSGVVQGYGWLDVSKTDDRETTLARARLLSEDLGVEVQPWSLEQVRDVLRSDHYFSAVNHPHAFQINPLAYALALAGAAERAGVYIFENTPVLSVDPAGVRKRISTANGRVRAGRVVLAGNVYLGNVANRIADTLVPVTAYTGVTKPLGARLASVMSYRGAVSDSRYGDYSYRIIDGDRLMWSGGVSIRKRNAAWMEKRLARAIRSTYPELGTVAFENFWSGTMGFAVHRMPQIGELAPGVWLTSGFGGQGINTSAIAGQLIARAIIDSDATWQNFLPYELVWAGGVAGRVVTQAMLSWWHANEALAASAARRHETLLQRRQREAAGEPVERVRPAYRMVNASRRMLAERIPARPNPDLPIAAPGARPHAVPAPEPAEPAPVGDSEEAV